MTLVQTQSRDASTARRDLAAVIDEAVDGRAPVISSRNRSVVVVDRCRFVESLRPSLPRPVAFAEENRWVILLEGLPIAADGETFQDAIEEFVEAVSEYAEDWLERLRLAPNHARNWPLVQFASLAEHDEFLDWVRSPG